MRISKTACGLLLTIACVAASPAYAQEKEKGAKPDPEQIQKQFEAFAKPGKEHKQFKRLVGRWECAVTNFYPNPAQPTKNKANAVIRVLMGGRYMQQNFRGTMEGKPFQGMSITGFDNAKKKYVGSWIDNGGTGIMRNEGTYDAKTQTLTEIGVSSSPMGTMKMKMVSKYMSDDKFLFTMFMLSEKGEQKIMEITYTRAKKGKKKKRKKKEE